MSELQKWKDRYEEALKRTAEAMDDKRYAEETMEDYKKKEGEIFRRNKELLDENKKLRELNNLLNEEKPEILELNKLKKQLSSLQNKYANLIDNAHKVQSLAGRMIPKGWNR